MRGANLVVLAFAFVAPWDANAQAGGPVETAVKFLEANQDRPCTEVWSFYSKGTQENIRAEVHRREREREAAPQAEVPEERYCRMYGKLKGGSARLVRQQGDEAVVSAGFSGRPSRSRYDVFPPLKEWTEEVKLIRESGAWKVERPRVKVGPTHVTLVEVGAVDVRIDPRVPAGVHQRLEATAVSRAPREGLERVLRDPTAWASVLPSFKAIERLERAGDVERVRLSFADPSRSTLFTVRLAGKPVDPKMTSTTRMWEVEGGDKAPAYMRGRWDLTDYSDGSTRVTLMLMIDPRHWHGSEGLFSAERMGNAVSDLEKAALKP